MPESGLSQARRQVHKAYGKAFASKASDALLLSIAQPLVFSATFRPQGVSFAVRPPLRVTAEAMGGAAPQAVGGPSTAILEIRSTEPGRRAAGESSPEAWQDLSSTLERVRPANGADIASVVRRLRATERRDAFYREVGSLREQFGRLAGEVRPESAASAGPQPVTQVCWLNSTMRTVAHLPTLAEVAQDAKVDRIGLPRLLKSEAAAASARDVLGAVAFRTRTGMTGKGIVVAVLDTEIAYKHKAFQGRVILKENYTREPWGHPGDHGTAVAGLLAANAPSLTGVAPAVTIYHYKVLAATMENSADDFGGARAIQQALEDGAHIANCSWGIGPAGDGTSREARAFDAAWDLGLVIVKSAGNVGSGGLTSPGDARGVIVVGATDRSGRRMIPESSHGSTPNGRKLDCVAPGGSSNDFLSSCKIDGRIGRVGFGTSFAAPQVAGILALLLEEDPRQTPDQLRAALDGLCHKLAHTDAGTQGRGLPVMS
jgi:serine protease AprX